MSNIDPSDSRYDNESRFSLGLKQVGAFDVRSYNERVGDDNWEISYDVQVRDDVADKCMACVTLKSLQKRLVKALYFGGGPFGSPAVESIAAVTLCVSESGCEDPEESCLIGQVVIIE